MVDNLCRGPWCASAVDEILNVASVLECSNALYAGLCEARQRAGYLARHKSDHTTANICQGILWQHTKPYNTMTGAHGTQSTSDTLQAVSTFKGSTASCHKHDIDR